MGQSLEQLTQDTFDRYNTDGPPERVYKAVSGHPVPRWEANTDQVVRHKWRAATSHAALAGADAVIALVAAGETDPDKLRAAMLETHGVGPFDTFANGTGPNPHAPKGQGKAIGFSGDTA